MPRLPRSFKLGPKTKVALGLLAALVLLVALFDWNWLRPGLERYLSHTAGRAVRAADLHLSLDADLQPVVRLRGVHVDNAPWADTRKPFVHAGELRFTFDWKSLFEDIRLIHHLVLIDAEINLERRADGLRNWRLTQPDYRGRGRIRLLALEPHNSRLSFAHEGVALVLQSQATELPQPEGPLTQKVSFSGSFRGAPFEGEALAGPVLTLLQTGRAFPLRGRAQTAQTVLQLDGEVADLAQLGGIDAKVQLSGPSLSQLKTFFPDPPWPTTQPYRAQAQLKREGNKFDARALRINLARSDVAGAVSYHAQDKRTTVRATLRSERLDSADLPSLKRKGPPGQRVLPGKALPLEQLDEMDAVFDWDIEALHIQPLRPLQGVRTHATLDHHKLQVAVKAAELAGGTLTGQFTLDTRLRTPEVRIEAQARALRLQTLWPAMPENARVDAPLDAHLQLTGQGHSLATWANSAGGQASVTLGSGTLSKRLAAQLSLNLGKLFGSLFDGDGAVALHCAALAIDVKDGVATTRQISLDTEKARVEGQGQLNAHDETWWVLLTPQKKRRFEPLTLGKSIRLEGSFDSFSQKLVDKEPADAAASEGCAAPRRAPG
ncbi:AsmA family protein [Sphaerotilaceae bacterium SBD11-9]